MAQYMVPENTKQFHQMELNLAGPELGELGDPGITNPTYSNNKVSDFDMLHQIEASINKKLSPSVEYEHYNKLNHDETDSPRNSWDNGSYHIYETADPIPTRESSVAVRSVFPSNFDFGERRSSVASSTNVNSINIAYYRDRRLLYALCTAVICLLLTSIVTICLLIGQQKDVDTESEKGKMVAENYSKTTTPSPRTIFITPETMYSTTPYAVCESDSKPQCQVYETWDWSHSNEDLEPVYKFLHVSSFNYSDLIDVPFEKSIEGDRFTVVNSNLGYTFQLHVFPSIHREIDTNWKLGGLIGAYLKYIDGPVNTLNATFTFFVRDSEGKDQNEMSVLERPLEKSGEGWGFTRFLSGDLETLVVKNILADRISSLKIGVVLELNHFLFYPLKILQKSQKSSWKMQKSTPSNLEKLKLSICGGRPHNWDFILISRDHFKFHCHKRILTEHSEYFRSILLNGSTKRTNKALFSMYSTPALREVLQFLYINCTSSNLPEVVEEVLKIAHIFLMPDLKWECQRTLLKQLNLLNSLQYLNLATEFQLDVLRNVAINYVLDNWSKLNLTSQLLVNNLYKTLLENASRRLKTLVI